MSAKYVAFNEIKEELENYRINHFLEGYKIASNKKIYCKNYFDFCGFSIAKSRKNYNKNDYKEPNFRIMLLGCINYGNDSAFNASLSYKNLNLSIDILLKEIVIWKNIIDEIDEFTINYIKNLKTYNINYLTHMVKNYKENTSDPEEHGAQRSIYSFPN